MKKVLLATAFSLVLSITASAFNLSLNYGGGFSTTSSSISFNYSGTCSDASTYCSGWILGTVYLDNGTNSYYVGEFRHCLTGGSTTAVVGAPGTPPNSNPYQSYTVPGFGSVAAVQNLTFSLSPSCYPTGSYNVRVVIEGYNFGIELDGYSFPSCDISVGSSYFPQPITNGFPYAHVTLVAADASIGTFNVSSGGSYNVSFGSIGTTCSSSGAIALSIIPGTANYSIWTQFMGSPTVTASTTPVINKPAGTYPVTVVDANGCRRDGSVTVAPPTMPTVSATKSPAQPPTGYCKQTCITLLATPSTGTGYTYQWKRNGVNISTSQSFCNMPGPSPTTTTYSVTISNSFGCTASGTVTALTNTSCIGATAACCLGPRREMQPSVDSNYTTIQVFPNPASEVVNIQFGDPSTFGTTLDIVDVTGKIVKSVDVPEGAICYTMDVSDLSSGTYVATVRNPESQIVSMEFIVE